MKTWRRVTLVVVLGSSLALAQDVPHAIAFAGRIADNGVLLNGSHDLKFRIFDAPANGNMVWEESRSGVMINDGLVDLQLGAVAPLTAAVFGGASMYLEVAVGSTVLSPRTVIASSPYALRASVANTAGTLGSLKPADVQQRVTGTCGPGSAISTVESSGSVSCQSIGSGTVSAVTAGTGLTGGTITSSGTIGLARTVQDWASQPTCSSGAFLTAISSSGTPTCGPGVTRISTGPGLLGGPISGAGTIDLAPTVPNWTNGMVPFCPTNSAIKSLGFDGTTTCAKFLAAPHGGMGYSFVSSTGVVDAASSYNSSGAGVAATRTATGTYTVTLTGLGAPAQPSGHFQLTAYSSGSPAFCMLGSATSLANASAQVLCYGMPSGALTDTSFELLWIQ